jgi:hypothetical protein
MGGKVPGAIVRERGRRIRDIAARLSRRFLESQVGKVHRALTLEDGTLAVTGNYLKVRIEPGSARNEWVFVKVTDVAGPPRGEVVRQVLEKIGPRPEAWPLAAEAGGVVAVPAVPVAGVMAVQSARLPGR